MKKRLQKFRKLLMMAAALLLAVFSVTSPVHAESSDGNQINTSANGSIKLQINEDEWYVEGTAFHIYKVSDISSDLKFTNTAAFKNADVDLEPVSLTGQLDATADKWEKASGKLIDYVNANKITDNGSAEMHGRYCEFRNLKPGLYLIQGDTGREGNRTVVYQPVLICIPQRASAEEAWNYNITAYVKSADPTYTHPTPTPSATPSTTSERPDTRDTFNAWVYAGVIVAMGFVIGYVIHIRKKERED